MTPITEAASRPSDLDLDPLLERVERVHALLRPGIAALIAQLEAWGSGQSPHALGELLIPVRVLLGLGDGDLAQMLQTQTATIARWRDGVSAPNPVVWSSISRRLIAEAERKLRLLAH